MVKEPYENKHPGTEAEPSHLGIIRNRKLALVWLRKNGWRASRSSLYRHIKEGRLPMAPAGTIDADDLKIYAAAYLQPTEAPPDHRLVVAVHEQERAARIELLQARRRKLDFEDELARGRYLERDAVLTEFCVKISVFESFLKTMARTHAEQWTQLVGGDADRAGELYQAIEAGIDEALDAMADMSEINVKIKRQTAAL